MNVIIVSSKYPPEYSGSGFRAHNTYKRLKKQFNIKFSVLASSITHPKSRKYIYDSVPVQVISNKVRPLTTNQDCGYYNKIARKFHHIYQYLFESIPVLFFLYQQKKLILSMSLEM